MAISINIESNAGMQKLTHSSYTMCARRHDKLFAVGRPSSHRPM